jgi:hypothetical protein
LRGGMGSKLCEQEGRLGLSHFVIHLGSNYCIYNSFIV